MSEVKKVERLETRAYVRSNGDVVKFRDGWLFDDTDPLVLRSQAEELLAAERARYRALEEIAAGLVERTDKAEASNAALTARIKKITYSLSNVVFINGVGHYINGAVAEHIKDVENQLEIASRALEWYANPEIYKPHPHGPAFDNRDVSYVARAALEGKI